MNRANSMTNAEQENTQYRWRGFAVALCLGVIVLGLPAVVHILNLVKIHGFPLGFFTTAHLVPVLCAALCWVVVSRQGVPPMQSQMCSMPKSSFFSGLSLAIAGFAVPLVIVLIDAAFNRGYDGLALGLGWIAGLVLLTTWTAPLLARRSLRSVPALLGRQTNSSNVERIGIFVAIVVSSMLLVAVLALLADNVSRIGKFAREEVLFVTAGIVGTIVMAVPRLGLRRLLLGCALVVLFAMLAVLVWIGQTPLGGSIPHFGYGNALQAIAELERQALVTGVADPVTFKVHARPEVHFDSVNFAVLTICLMLATAVMPHILCVVDNEKSPSKTGPVFLMGAIATTVVLLLVLTAPEIAAIAKLFVFREIIAQPVSQLPSWLAGAPGHISVAEICGQAASDMTAVVAACAGETDHDGVVQVDDVRLVGFQPVLLVLAATKAPIWIWVASALGATSAFLSFILAQTAVLKTSFLAYNMTSNSDAQPSVGKPAGTANANISVFVVVIVAAVLAMIVERAATELFVGSFGIAAGALVPALLVTMLRPNTRASVVTIGMVVGLLVGLFYLLATLFAPIMFFHLTMGLSTAADYAKEDYFELLTLWRSAGVDEKSAAWKVLTEHTRPLANWWGLRPAAAGIFGLTFGSIAMVLAMPFFTVRAQIQNNPEI